MRAQQVGSPEFIDHQHHKGKEKKEKKQNRVAIDKHFLFLNKSKKKRYIMQSGILKQIAKGSLSKGFLSAVPKLSFL